MLKHFNKFETTADYEAAALDYPNISYIESTDSLSWQETRPPYGVHDYMTTIAKSDGTISFSGSSATNLLSYSINGGEWAQQEAQNEAVTVTAGDEVRWKGSNMTATSNKGIGRFSSTAQFEVEGNIMSLTNGDSFDGVTTMQSYQFYELFHSATGLTSAENLVLQATSLTLMCYYGMFNGCTSLTTAPQLPATTLATFCYVQMFNGCTSLTTAPQLPATTLASDCYLSMFKGCTSLTEAPQLPATTLASSCYQYMFQGCTNLTTAPELPATTLADYCYMHMFDGCTSLTTAPELPATTLASDCYLSMFKGCTSLTEAPELPATTLANGCYRYMFMACTRLTAAPQLPATTLADSCYQQMFQLCSRLNSITCLATDISASGCTDRWTIMVASTGTFTKAASMTSWPSGDSGIPNGWTVVDQA